MTRVAVVARMVSIVLLWCCGARAGELSLTVSLRVDPKDVPRIVCVHVPTKGIAGINDQTVPMSSLRHRQGRFEPPDASGSPWRTTSHVLAAVRALTRPAEVAHVLCGAPDGVCTPEFPAAWTRAPDGFLMCAPNRDRDPSDSRLSVALLELTPVGASSLAVNRLDVAGRTVVLSFTGTSPLPPYSMSVVGGHYVSSGSADVQPVVDGAVTLALESRCLRRILTLPLAAIPEQGQYTISLASSDDPLSRENALDPSCREFSGPLGGHPWLDVILPNAQIARLKPTEQLVFNVTLTATGGNLGFRSSWSGAPPDSFTQLRYSRTSFTWQKHCLVTIADKSGCPTVTVPEVDGTCEKSYDIAAKRCRYECSSATTTFSLPVGLRFTTDHDGAWVESLTGPWKNLSGYIPLEQHALVLSYAAWENQVTELANRAWQKIRYIEIRGPGGATYRIHVAGEAVALRVPGLGCADHVSYRYVGDRPYREEVVAVEGGTILLKVPEELADDSVDFGLTLGGGAYTSALLSDVLPYATVQALLIWHALPTQKPGWPAAFRPWLELRAGYVFSNQYYLGIGDGFGFFAYSGLYNRFEGTVGTMFPLSDNWYGGPQIGIGIGRAARSIDIRVLHNQRTFLWGATIGYRPAQGPIGLELAMHLASSESIAVFSTDFQGDAQRQTVPTTPLFTDIKLRVGW